MLHVTQFRLITTWLWPQRVFHPEGDDKTSGAAWNLFLVFRTITHIIYHRLHDTNDHILLGEIYYLHLLVDIDIHQTFIIFLFIVTEYHLMTVSRNRKESFSCSGRYKNMLKKYFIIYDFSKDLAMFFALFQCQELLTWGRKKRAKSFSGSNPTQGEQMT